MAATLDHSIKRLLIFMIVFATSGHVVAQQIQKSWEKQFVKSSTLESHIFPVMMEELQDSLNPAILMVNALDHQAEIFKIDTASNQLWKLSTDTFISSHTAPVQISDDQYLYAAISCPIQMGVGTGDLMLVTFNEQGKLNKTVFTSSDFLKLTSSHAFSDTSILLVGDGLNEILIYQMDTNGQEIWQTSYSSVGSINIYNANLSVIGKKNILFTATTLNSNIPVVCLSADSGKVKWEMDLNDSLAFVPIVSSSPIATEDSQYYYVAFHIATQHASSLVINKIDSSGKLLYQKIHQLLNSSNYMYINEIEVDKKGIALSISMKDSIYLVLLNKQTGILDWKIAIGQNHLGRGFAPMQQLSLNDNHIVMSYSNNLDTTNMDLHISIFNRLSGNELDEVVFNTTGRNSNDSPFQLIKSRDNQKIFILGASDNPNMSISAEEIQSFLLSYNLYQTTSVEDFIKVDQTIKIYPNPLKDYLIFYNNKVFNGEISIFDSQARLVKKISARQKSKSSLLISTQSLKAGVYFLLAEGETGIYRSKFEKL